MTNSIQIAHAKLTVYLKITGIREDGYHLIDSEMVSLDMADTLEFSDGEGLEVVGNDRVPTGANNLIAKALNLAGAKAHVRLTKSIPMGGGLGGGSSDAAAALRWAGCSEASLAAQVGSDVPFCLWGGRARVRGVGEILEPLPYEDRVFTLLLPPFGVNTAAVYAMFDRQSPSSTATNSANDLESAAMAVEPRLMQWRDRLAGWTGAKTRLAGSGSTWFVEGAHTKPPDSELQGARWIVARTVPAVASQTGV